MLQAKRLLICAQLMPLICISSVLAEVTSIEAPKQASDESAEVEVDERIKVRVTPLVSGPVIDRVMEPTMVTVRAPGATTVEVYLEPVDAPYGGRTTGAARLLGRSTNSKGFNVSWSSPEPHRYVRLYALAFCGLSAPMRSAAVDLGMGGRRLLPEVVDSAAKPGEPLR